MSMFFKALEQAERERTRDAAVGAAGQLLNHRPPVVEREVGLPASRDRNGAVDLVPAGGHASPAADGIRSARTFDAPARGIDERLVSLIRPSSVAAAQYRALRHTIQQLHAATGLSVIAVSSPGLADGKTTTAINLAGSLAQAANDRVLLIDLDLRNPCVAARLGGRKLTTPGLVDAIGRPELALADVVRHYQPYNLAVLPAGAQPPLPDEVVASPRLGMLLEEARRQYDYIVVDTPPLVGALEGRVISRWVDGFLLVVAAHRTPRRLLEDALNLMDEAKTIGLVFNQADDVPVAYR